MKPAIDAKTHKFGIRAPHHLDTPDDSQGPQQIVRLPGECETKRDLFRYFACNA